jgi:phosphotransferase system, enzyme I, PtsP
MKIHAIKKDALFSIMDLGGLINSTEDLPKVLHLLVEKISHLMGSNACSLYLYNQGTQLLTLKAAYGLNRGMVDNVTTPLGVGLTGQVIKILKPISVADANKTKGFRFIPGLGEEKYASFLSIPLVYNGDPIGVLNVQKTKRTLFKKRDVELLMSLAIPAVSLIEKAKFMGTVGSVSNTQPANSDESIPEVTIEYLKDHFIKGIPAVPGICMGRLKIVKSQIATTQNSDEVIDVEDETKHLEAAFAFVKAGIQETKTQAEKRFGPDEASIFEAYLLFLESNAFRMQIITEIKRGLSAVKSLEIIVGKYMERMSQAQDEYIKERAYDIQDVARKISDYLMHGDASVQNRFETDEDTIFLNDFWSVSDFVSLEPKYTRGLISPHGGASSHISILADTLNLPTVLGLGSSCAQLRDNDYVIVDGYAGTIIINPTPSTIDIYKNEIAELEKRNKLFQNKKNQKVRLGKKNKRVLPVGANLGMVAHINNAIDSGADEVGLYRTEFPFLVRTHLPTEEEQFLIYKRVVELMKGKVVVFRSLDIGGDKYVSYLNLPRESNPALGWRAIRFSLERKDLFRIQLRAMLRASAFGKIRLLFPMVTSVEQIYEVKEVLESVKKELTEEKVKFAKKIPFGAMIEVPASVMIASKLSKIVDFFSIGTNDLIQYCLAVDRTNPLVADLYDPYHPSILKMISQTVQAAHRNGIPVSVCGDMANKPELAALLIGLGVDSLSMIPRSIPKIKYLTRLMSEEDLANLSKQCLSQDSGTKIKELVHQYFNKNKLSEFIHKPTVIETSDE